MTTFLQNPLEYLRSHDIHIMIGLIILLIIIVSIGMIIGGFILTNYIDKKINKNTR